MISTLFRNIRRRFSGPAAGAYRLTGLQGKTLWDVLDLIIVPLVLGLGVVWFNFQQSDADRKLEADRAEAERELAAEAIRENSLQSYLDRMSDLLLKEELSNLQTGGAVRDLARARTLSTLRQLDGQRKGLLVRFLYDAGLIGTVDAGNYNAEIFLQIESGRSYTEDTLAVLRGERGHDVLQTDPIINLDGADLRLADLRGSDLKGAVLSGANLERADLRGANLRWADIEDANLRGANLSGPGPTGRTLRLETPQKTDLRGVNLTGSDLTGADLSGAHLAAANLCRATADDGQLDLTVGEEHAILPNGSIGAPPCNAASLKWVLNRNRR